VEEACDGVVDLITVGVSLDKWYNDLYSKFRGDSVKYPDFKIEDEQLFKLISLKGEKLWVRVIPPELRQDVMKECHDEPVAGHLGARKPFFRIRELYFWPNMKDSCLEYVKKCEICLAHKSSHGRPMGLMGKQRKVNAPMQVISTDLMGPFPRSISGYQYLILTVCLFTKYVWLKPLRKATAQAVATHLEEDIFLKFGSPRVLLSDNGVQFRNGLIRGLCERYGILQWFTHAYHPEANPTERTNRVIKGMISSYLKDHQRVWEKNLAKITAAVNSAVHEVTGYSPHQLMFGERLKLHGCLRNVETEDGVIPLNASRGEWVEKDKGRQEMFKDVSKRIDKACKKNVSTYNLRRRERKLRVGDIVWRRNFAESDAVKYYNAKLGPKFVGPYEIVELKGSGVMLKGRDARTEGPWHLKDLQVEE